MRRNYPDIQFERYADDVICHCSSQHDAQALKKSLEARFSACYLTLHPDKTHVVYCRDSNRRGPFEKIQFEFLGFAFRPRCAKNRWGRLFTTFAPAASPLSLKKMRDRIRGWRLRHHTHLPLE
jgi:RNA-directed DNA polymerase